jgi:hypothetical protein
MRNQDLFWINARRALVRVGSPSNQETPWSPPGKAGSNVVSRRSLLLTSLRAEVYDPKIANHRGPLTRPSSSRGVEATPARPRSRRHPSPEATLLALSLRCSPREPSVCDLGPTLPGRRTFVSCCGQASGRTTIDHNSKMTAFALIRSVLTQCVLSIFARYGLREPSGSCASCACHLPQYAAVRRIDSSWHTSPAVIAKSGSLPGWYQIRTILPRNAKPTGARTQ